MFELVYNISKVGKFDTFVEAFIKLYELLSKDLEETGTAWQLVETSIWIQEGSKDPMMFYDARDYACEIGLLINGKLNEKMVEESKRINGLSYQG